MTPVVRGLALGVAISAALSSCIIKRLTTPRLTGTCDGACAHYIECKPGHPEADRASCAKECPDVFRDRDSLMAYESLACEDAVSYIDGPPTQTAAPARR